MRAQLLTLSVIATVSAASQAWPTVAPLPGQSVRVSGDGPAAEQTGDFWKWGAYAIDESPLPVGYTAPTPPGQVEVKTYPSIRRAEYDSTQVWASWAFAQSRMFWKLFNHITSNKIEMTSPVEMDLRDYNPSGSFFGGASVSGWKMSFVYRAPELGPLGSFNGVNVIDTKEVTVLSIGFGDDADLDDIITPVQTLKSLLAGQSTW